MKRMRLSLAFFSCIVLLISTIGCAEQHQDASQKTKKDRVELVVAGAASLKDLFEQIGQQFEQKHPEVKVRFNFAGSNILARQIEAGAPIDVVALASVEIMNRLDSSSLILPTSRRIFAQNNLCLVVPTDSPFLLNKLSDLRENSITRIAVASPGVPARLYTEEALRNAKEWEQLLPRFVYGTNVRQVLSYVEHGEVDCGFVYTSDVQVTERVRIAFVIDNDLHSLIGYPVGIVQSSAKTQLASQFIQYLHSNALKALIQRYGFE